MKLDATLLRYLDEEDFRVLVAVEMGMKNHVLVPTPLIERISGLRYGGTKKILRRLCRMKLIHHEAKMYEGYKLVYLGYDFLALTTFGKRGRLHGIGGKVGVGKESDIYLVQDEEHQERILKLHRLGRTSFQTVTQNRDYLRHRGQRKGASWYYMSRLAAAKEFAFMKALFEAGFPVPTPVDQNRHAVLMSVIAGYPLANVTHMVHPQRVYQRLLDLVTRLAQYGLIHGDFNQFNVLVNDNEEVFMIDFPQMTSTEHPNAQMYFDRDINCVHDYFRKRYNLYFDYHPKLKGADAVERTHDLDAQVRASGWSDAQEEEWLKVQAENPELQLRQDEIYGEDRKFIPLSDEEEEDEEDEEENDGDEVEKPAESEAPTAASGEGAQSGETKKKETEGEADEDEDDEDEEEEEEEDTSSRASRRRRPKKEKEPAGDKPLKLGVSAKDIKNRVKSKLEKENSRAASRLAHANKQKNFFKSTIRHEVASGDW
eukprot:TRINITY_DN2053_c0_g1_i1.p1 TRINITY_DN2053_c0_g1~~TRINITY_DN2053_c0_g1_i1.p1  ORF type:complete len:485 (+),score=129.87 TRINITY_DN2053_c0_g1_i1:67-1521(+)